MRICRQVGGFARIGLLLLAELCSTLHKPDLGNVSRMNSVLVKLTTEDFILCKVLTEILFFKNISCDTRRVSRKNKKSK